MELEKAKEGCKLLLAGDIYVVVKNENDEIDYSGTCGKNYNKAIETVLQALDNSISKDKVREKIEELSKHKMDIVTSPIHNTDEKLEMLKRNQIKIEIFKELLEDK